jgi:hypothetical protein
VSHDHDEQSAEQALFQPLHHLLYRCAEVWTMALMLTVLMLLLLLLLLVMEIRGAWEAHCEYAHIRIAKYFQECLQSTRPTKQGESVQLVRLVFGVAHTEKLWWKQAIHNTHTVVLGVWGTANEAAVESLDDAVDAWRSPVSVVLLVAAKSLAWPLVNERLGEVLGELVGDTETEAEAEAEAEGLEGLLDVHHPGRM